MVFAPTALYVAVMFDLKDADASEKLDGLRATWPGLALFHLDERHVVGPATGRCVAGCGR